MAAGILGGGGGGGGPLVAGRREEIFRDVGCDSLLPESIPDCKLVEIAQNFPPPAGSFSESFKTLITNFPAESGFIS